MTTVRQDFNELMNAHTNAGIAYAEFLLVTSFEKENPLMNKNLLPSVYLI